MGLGALMRVNNPPAAGPHRRAFFLGTHGDPKGLAAKLLRHAIHSRVGHLIVSVSNQPVTDAETFRGMLESATSDRGILVLIRRGDQTLFRVLKPSAVDPDGKDGKDEDGEGDQESPGGER